MSKSATYLGILLVASKLKCSTYCSTFPSGLIKVMPTLVPLRHLDPLKHIV